MNNHSRTRLLYIRRKINRFFIAALNDTYEFDVRNNARVFLTSETFRKRWGLDDYRQFLCGIEANVGFFQRWTWGDIFLFFSFFFFFFFRLKFFSNGFLFSSRSDYYDSAFTTSKDFLISFVFLVMLWSAARLK